MEISIINICLYLNIVECTKLKFVSKDWFQILSGKLAKVLLWSRERRNVTLLCSSAFDVNVNERFMIMFDTKDAYVTFKSETEWYRNLLRLSYRGKVREECVYDWKTQTHQGFFNWGSSVYQHLKIAISAKWIVFQSHSPECIFCWYKDGRLLTTFPCTHWSSLYLSDSLLYSLDGHHLSFWNLENAGERRPSCITLELDIQNWSLESFCVENDKIFIAEQGFFAEEHVNRISVFSIKGQLLDHVTHSSRDSPYGLYLTYSVYHNILIVCWSCNVQGLTVSENGKLVVLWTKNYEGRKLRFVKATSEWLLHVFDANANEILQFGFI